MLRDVARVLAVVIGLSYLGGRATAADAAVTASDAAPTAAPAPAAPITTECTSRVGERQVCPADTSKGVTLASSGGDAPCLLGKTWGYDDHNIWVSDGCSGRFVTAATIETVGGAARRGEGGPRALPQPGLQALRRREGPDLHAALLLRPLPEPEGAGSELHRLRSATPRTCRCGRTSSSTSSSCRSRAGSSRRSSATTSTSGRRTPRRATPRRSWAPGT